MQYLTIQSYHQALADGADAHELVRYYIERIERFDQKGPAINAIIAINPDWEKELTEILETVDPSAPLFAVPVLVKDNIDVKGMATTAGNQNLLNNIAVADAPIVERIRAAGGLVLAKTNLHEFAIWGETISSVLGQTLNPYDLTRTPGGSSGGTGAALAMDFGIVGLGTDTINSVRSPASANNLVGLRPSQGALSSDGIIPYSLTQDTAGPLSRNLSDLEVLYRVMAADDEEVDMPIRPRIGVLRSFFGNHPDVNRVMTDVLTRFAPHAELIELDEAFNNQYLIDEVSVHLFDLKDHLGQYLEKLEDSPIRTLEDVLASGKYHPGIEANMLAAAKLSTKDEAYQPRIVEARKWAEKLHQLYEKHDLLAIIYPHQQQLVCEIGGSQLGRNGVLASITGFCSLCMPAGFSHTTSDAPLGVPIGFELLGRPGDDLWLIELGKRIEDRGGFKAPVSGEE